MDVADWVEGAGRALDLIGVAAILVGIAYAAVLTLIRSGERYVRFRRITGRGILLGLEILVAADIIRTVALDPTLENAITLAVIVAVRTLLSLTLTVEIDGRWPWQPKADAAPPGR